MLAEFHFECEYLLATNPILRNYILFLPRYEAKFRMSRVEES